MKKNHSGKIRFHLNIVTGEVIPFPTKVHWNDKIDPSYVSIGMFYSFAEFKASFNADTNLWTVTRGTTIITTVFQYPAFTTIQPYYFETIIAKRVTKRLINS